jgi:hypothetical protein
MKLPRVEYAVIPRRKLEDYLLHLEHPIGGGKAKFFIRFGFHRERWEQLAKALLQHAQDNPVTEVERDVDGVSYIVEGGRTTPSGRKPQVRVVWLLETGELAPRFITAYPVEA